MNVLKPALLAAACAALALAAPLQAQVPAKPAAAPAVAPVDAEFAQWDADHNGVLSLQEFRQGWHARTTEIIQARLRGQFANIDADDDGAIGAAEYGNLALVRRAGAAAPPLARFDGNKDGRLQFAEYLQLLRQLAPAEGPAAATGRK